MDTIGRHTRRLWIDPNSISSLFDGLGGAAEDQDTAHKDAYGRILGAETAFDFLTEEAVSAPVVVPARVSEVSPEIQLRLNERLARIRSLATESGAIVGRSVDKTLESRGEKNVKRGAHSPHAKVAKVAKVALGTETGSWLAPDQSEKTQGDSEYSNDAHDSAGYSGEENVASDWAAGRGGWGERGKRVTLENGATKQPADDVSPSIQDEKIPVSDLAEIATFSPSQELLWGRFEELGGWIFNEFGINQFAVIDEQGESIEVRGLERERLEDTGDLALLFQRGRRAIGNTETGIHLATARGAGEYFCVINCSSERFPICIGLLTAERISFRKMLLIGSALEKTLTQTGGEE